MYRVRHLENDAVQSNDAATYSLRLPVSGNLHTLMITCHMTNGATAGRAVSMHDVVDEIRVVGDGDERFFTLNSPEFEKWYETLRGIPLRMIQNEAADAVQEITYPVMFGRGPYDPNMFLPLGRVKNPRLEIVYSPSIAADGGFATGTFTVNVIALWSPEEDRLNYAGTLVTRTIESFTSVASGDNTTDVDILDPIRAIGVYGYEAAVEDGTDITRVRLEANSGEYDLWQGDWQDLLDYNKTLFWSMIEHNFHAFLHDTDTLLTRLGHIQSLSVTVNEDVVVASDTFPVVNVDTITGDRLTFNVSTATIAAGSEALTALTSDQDLLVSAKGDSPSYFGLLPFMHQDEPGGYLNPRNYDKLRLILTQGGAGATVRNAIQFLKTY